MTTIRLGCGLDPNLEPGAVNVDILDLPGVQVVHNLIDLPYPFPDEYAQRVEAIDVVEHLPNYTPSQRPMIPAFIEEVWRILKLGGTLFMQTPRHDAAFLWTDPTHVRGFDEHSFDFWDPATHFGATTGFYSKARFHRERVETLENRNLRFWLTKVGLS